MMGSPYTWPIDFIMIETKFFSWITLLPLSYLIIDLVI
jgi:hypothetical protein